MKRLLTCEHIPVWSRMERSLLIDGEPSGPARQTGIRLPPTMAPIVVLILVALIGLPAPVVSSGSLVSASSPIVSSETLLFASSERSSVPAAVGPAARAVGAPSPSSPDSSADRPLLLEQIVVAGNRRLTDEAIISAVRLSPGDTVSVHVLERERMRLLQIHAILSDVSFFTRPGSARGTVVLEIDVVERTTFSLETGYGYHDVNGWFLTLLGLRFDRPYDTDSQLRLGLRFG
ncbi:MAG: hypothetical protein V2A71_04730, partial [Candidatus Eisenbacteria bacterium]